MVENQPVASSSRNIVQPNGKSKALQAYGRMLEIIVTLLIFAVLVTARIAAVQFQPKADNE